MRLDLISVTAFPVSSSGLIEHHAMCFSVSGLSKTLIRSAVSDVPAAVYVHAVNTSSTMYKGLYLQVSSWPTTLYITPSAFLFSCRHGFSPAYHSGDLARAH